MNSNNAQCEKNHRVDLCLNPMEKTVETLTIIKKSKIPTKSTKKAQNMGFHGGEHGAVVHATFWRFF